MIARGLFRWLSPAGANARLTVLIFHRVLAEPDPLFPGEPDAQRFRQQMEWIKTWFNVLPLAEAIEHLQAGDLPARAASITFDDGYADNLTVALPILRSAGLSATIFIATGYLDGGRMFNDTVIELVRNANGTHLDLSRWQLGRYGIGTIEERRLCIAQLLAKLKYLEPTRRAQIVDELVRALKISPSDRLMLTTEQVRELAQAGVSIGAHTVSHPILAKVDEDAARTEMKLSKERLEAITGSAISLFAYPNGKPGTDYTATHVRLARDVGFTAACSTGWGTARRGSDLFQIPRFTPWDRTPARYALRLGRNMREPVVEVH